MKTGTGSDQDDRCLSRFQHPLTEARSRWEVAQDTKCLVEQEFSQGELLAHYSAGRLHFAADDPAPTKTTGHSAKPAPIQDHRGKEKRTLQRRWSALEPLTRLGRAPQEIDYTNRVGELQNEGKNFSARTLHRYYHAWLRAGKDRMARVPRGARARQSRGARKSSLLEKHPQIRKLVDEAIQAIYLTKARRPIGASPIFAQVGGARADGHAVQLE